MVQCEDTIFGETRYGLEMDSLGIETHEHLDVVFDLVCCSYLNPKVSSKVQVGMCERSGGCDSLGGKIYKLYWWGSVESEASQAMFDEVVH